MSSPAESPTAATVSTAHVDNMLKNYRHDQIVYALMTQLREKETEVAAFAEQRQRLQRKSDRDDQAREDQGREIAVLERQLAEEKKDSGPSKQTAATLQHLAETNAACERSLRAREEELSRLKPILKKLKAKVDDYEKQEHVRLVEQLGGELATTRAELASAEHTNVTSNTTIENLEKKVKGKQWMVKSLQEDSVVQRSRENHLLAHINTLDEKIDTYETRFKGKGVDVPILLAKLKDYEVRVKHLQGKVRMLTNKKLNEMVTRTSGSGSKDEARQDAAESKPKTSREVMVARTPGNSGSKDEARQDAADSKPKAPGGVVVTRTSGTSGSKDEARQEAADSLSKASSGSFSDAHSDEEEEGTFASLDSHASDEMEEHFHDPQPAREKGFLGDILSDFHAGIESLKVDLCCAQATAAHRAPASPLGAVSPASFDSRGFDDPASHSISLTFTPGSPAHHIDTSGTASPTNERDNFPFV